MRIPIAVAMLVLLFSACDRSGGVNEDPGGRGAQEALPECEWCGADEAPKNLKGETTIAGAEEEGRRLIISGTVYQADGQMPASDVMLYVYHTNSEGVYPKRGDETGNGRRHGYLRSWLRTNEQGQYRFTTIKPAPYPGRSDPAHIHVTVKPSGGAEHWIDSIIFEGDSLITADYRAKLENRGGSGIVVLEMDDKGVLRGRRDITLEPSN